MNASQRRGLVSGLIFTGLGVMFLLEAFDVYTLAPSTLWPLLLISLGVGVLAGIGGSDEGPPTDSQPMEPRPWS